MTAELCFVSEHLNTISPSGGVAMRHWPRLFLGLNSKKSLILKVFDLKILEFFKSRNF